MFDQVPGCIRDIWWLAIDCLFGEVGNRLVKSHMGIATTQEMV
jgi:hypothetical protein